MEDYFTQAQVLRDLRMQGYRIPHEVTILSAADPQHDPIVEPIIKRLCELEVADYAEFRQYSTAIAARLAMELNFQQKSHPDVTRAIVPVLTAGDYLVPGVQGIIGQKPIYYVGIERDRNTLEPKVYKNNMLGAINPADHVIVLEPMLATGGSAQKAIEIAYEWGAKQVTLLSVLGVPEGLNRIVNMFKRFPDTRVILAGMGLGLTDKGYIYGPTIGDYGDKGAGRIVTH